MSQPTRNAINWFEIPVQDLGRAQKFYEAVLAAKLRRETMAGGELVIFPYDEPSTGGCLMGGEGMTPSATGTMVYLDATPSLDAVLARVPAAGGRVALARTELPDGMGCFAHIVDTEGNRVGLHAMR